MLLKYRKIVVMVILYHTIYSGTVSANLKERNGASSVEFITEKAEATTRDIFLREHSPENHNTTALRDFNGVVDSFVTKSESTPEYFSPTSTAARYDTAGERLTTMTTREEITTSENCGDTTRTTAPTQNGTDASSDTVTSAPPREAAEETVSQELYERMMAAFHHVSFDLEVLSLVLTSLSACLHALPSMRCSTAVYLVALNAADTVGGLLTVARSAWLLADPGASRLGPFHRLTRFGSVFLSVVCRRLLYCLTLLLNAERLFVIVCPLRARYTRIIRFPKTCIAVLVAAVLAYHVYLPLKYRVTSSAEGQGHALTLTEAYIRRREVFDDVSNAAKCLFAYLPLSLCLLLCLALRAALRRHAVKRESMRARRHWPRRPEGLGERAAATVSSAETQLASTIWLSTLLFTLLSLPSNTVQVVSSYHPTFRYQGAQHKLYTLVSRFASLALVLTRYTNFFTYLCLSTAFRQNLLRLCCWKKVVRRLSRGRAEPGTTLSYISGCENVTMTMVPAPTSVDV